MYFGAGITKIQTAAFFSGEQMRYWMLSNWNYNNPVGEVIAMWSPLLLMSAYLTVVWEILFAFLVWQPRWRILMLGVGAGFHFMTWLLLGLYVFPAICVSSYLAFVSETDVLKIRGFISRHGWRHTLSRPLTWASAVLERAPSVTRPALTWTCALLAAGFLSAELDHRLDLYGNNGQKYALQPMDATVAKAMISREQKVREKDKFFNFEIGTSTIGNQLANRRTEFRFGEQMIAQCQLNPPHEDMWVECNLEDAEGHTIDQFGQFVTRDMMRANFEYALGNRLVAGDYVMVLKSANQEIYRRPFRLTGTPPQSNSVESLLTN
ncbi:MAG: HTTM domain-containing protein [Planctomycetaceae bacterium]